jgi:hypothetical protein
MFAKLAQSLGFGRRHAALSKAAPCNDNHPARPLATISRAPRRALVCGWRRREAARQDRRRFHIRWFPSSSRNSLRTPLAAR